MKAKRAIQRRVSVLCALLVLLGQAGSAHHATAQPSQGVDQTVPLPSLDEVIDQLLQYDPAMAASRMEIEKSEALLKRESRSWLTGISAGVRTTAGTYGNDTVDQINVGTTGGLGIQISLYDVFGRGSSKRAYEADVEISTFRAERTRSESIQDVVRMYRSLETTAAQVILKADSWRTAQIHREMAELEFSNGDITIFDLSRVTESEARAQSDYVATVGEYKSLFDQLGVRIGKSLDEF